jgi:pimeloyl-ACP methyl ester carboxylesterase
MARSRRRVGRWLARGALLLVVLFVLAAAGAFGVEALNAARDRRNHPAPGQLVDVGGYRLHIYCTGPAAAVGAPTVILEGMSGASVPHWSWVQRALEADERVCSYDRAGYGWSDAGPGSRDLTNAANDLQALLAGAGEEGPFVVVGHSLGGLIARRYAADHPDRVVGLVLVDSSHPQQFVRHPEYRADIDASAGMLQAAPLLARFGLLRLYVRGNVDFGNLPPEAQDALLASWSSTKHWQAEADALAGYDAFFEQAQALRPLDDLPLTVVTAGGNAQSGWTALQDDLATLSTNTVHLTIAGATHASLTLNREHAERVSDAIRDTVRRAMSDPE